MVGFGLGWFPERTTVNEYVVCSIVTSCQRRPMVGPAMLALIWSPNTINNFSYEYIYTGRYSKIHLELGYEQKTENWDLTIFGMILSIRTALKTRFRYSSNKLQMLHPIL